MWPLNLHRSRNHRKYSKQTAGKFTPGQTKEKKKPIVVEHTVTRTESFQFQSIQGIRCVKVNKDED